MRGQKLIVAIILLFVSLQVVGSSGCRYFEKWQTPTPPANAFPTQIGKLKIREKVISVREDQYIRHEADYQIADDDLSRINYYLKIYPSDSLATAALESRSKVNNPNISVTWEDRRDNSGQLLGKMLKESSVRNQTDGSTVGYCSYSYVKGSQLITVVKMFECEPAKQFLQELSY